MRTKPDDYYRQSAVIPYRQGASGLEVLLIKNRKGRRWIVPKGIVEPDLSAAQSAAKEAYEEAGIEGRVAPDPVGAYEYEKWGDTCRVEVYVMEVERQLSSWPESFRDREWVSPQRAADRVREPKLKQLIGALAAGVG
jgi:phosphohistidine phosphatase